MEMDGAISKTMHVWATSRTEAIDWALDSLDGDPLWDAVEIDPQPELIGQIGEQYSGAKSESVATASKQAWCPQTWFESDDDEKIFLREGGKRPYAWRFEVHLDGACFATYYGRAVADKPVHIAEGPWFFDFAESHWSDRVSFDHEELVPAEEAKP